MVGCVMCFPRAFFACVLHQAVALRSRANCPHIASGVEQRTFLAYQSTLDFQSLDIDSSVFNFDWGKSFESECLEATSGRQLGFTTFRAAAKELASGGIVMCGDSTVRNLFAHICGFQNGVSQDDLEKYKSTLKSESGQTEICPGANIEFAPYYTASPPDTCINAIQNSSAKYKFVGMPGLHTLWSPGDRERFGTICTYETLEALQQTLSRAISLLAPHGVVFGTASAVCNEQLGFEGALCQIYKSQREFARLGRQPTDAAVDLGGSHYNSTQCVSEFTALERTRLSSGADGGILSPRETAYLDGMNSTGRIQPYPWLHCATASDKDDGYDSFLFMDEGIQHFNKIAMKLLEKYPGSLVVDMHGATKGRCNFAGDGRHYGDPVLKMQASLLATTWKFQEL